MCVCLCAGYVSSSSRSTEARPVHGGRWLHDRVWQDDVGDTAGCWCSDVPRSLHVSVSHGYSLQASLRQMRTQTYTHTWLVLIPWMLSLGVWDDLMGDNHFIKFSAGADLCELMWCLVLGGEKNENCALDDSYYIALTVRQCVNKVPYLLVDLVTKIQWPIWLTHFSCTPVTEVMSVVVSFCLQVVCHGWLGDSPPSLTGWVLLNISVTPQSHHSLPWCYVAETDSMSRRSLCWSPALQCCLCHVHEYSYTASVISLGPDL